MIWILIEVGLEAKVTVHMKPIGGNEIPIRLAKANEEETFLF